ncbi:MAG TPA: PEP/pyruvate-binding domain-containing protein [Kofleriaceae bacterium]|nr:PEP/pyruvate-binding domain-containing protein [Kofleriaceae bacterium]
MTCRSAVVMLAVLAGCKSSEPPKPVVASDARVASAADASVPVDAREVAPNPVPDTAPAQRLWIHEMKDAATFEAYSKEVGGERFAKFVVDLKTNAIYYFDVNVYPVHKDFIFGALYKKPKTKEAVRVFDKNYGANKTDFIMCYLVHHLNADQWTFAFWDGDLAKPEHVRLAYKKIQQTFFNAAKVRFRPDSNYQEGVAKETKDVPHVLNDELYKLADYASFNKGVAIGKLRMVPPNVPETELAFADDEIVVLQTPLSDITPVAGIISETFSTPLSHVNLRAKGWKIPNVGLRDAQRKLAELADKIVYFEAKDAEYVIRAATAEEIAADAQRRTKKTTIAIPVVNLDASELSPLSEMRAKDDVIFGPKAANLGEILHANLPGFEVPPGFGIPFRYYRDHLAAAGIDKQLDALLADPQFLADQNVRKQKLEQLRKAIEAAPLAPELRAKVEAGLATLPPDAGVFVRSSTNAEDLSNFSGAGLHDTKPNVRGLDAVCDAIKYVWASTWTLRAFEARQHAGIDQRKVYGAALIQLGVPATAAGVVATVHPTDPNDEKNYTVNAKSGLGMAVVDGRKVPESLIVSWYNRGIRVLSRSDEDKLLVFDGQGGVREVLNPSKGKPVLTNKMALDLAQVARALTKLFKNPKLDIEWVYVADKLYIVQTRPLVGQ